jgi:hypothetical protein
MTNFARTAAWLEACGKVPGQAADISVQLGCDAEETAELFNCIRLNHERAQEVLERIAADLEWLGGKLKRGEYIAHIPVHLRDMALDAICDREITGNGIAFLAGMSKDQADQAVLASNDAKLVDGKPVILPGGKIGKPDLWRAPDLSSFV